MTSSTLIKSLGNDLLASLPTVSAAFAYGSGVFTQPELYTSNKQPVVDFLFAVEHPLAWHQKNVRDNPTHYTGLARYSPRWTNFISLRIGVGLHFNSYVPFQNRLVKYGVIDVENFCLDLKTWKHLYVSGRLHKPVLWIKGRDEFAEALEFNIRAAFATGLLLSPNIVSKIEFFRVICELSYGGDIRMRIAEDSEKTKRIVKGSFREFEELYHSPITRQIADLVQLKEQDDGFLTFRAKEKRKELLTYLPDPIRKELQPGCFNNSSFERRLLLILAKRVSRSSRKQTLAGFLGAGMCKSLYYLSEKLKKGWKWSAPFKGWNNYKSL